MKFVSSWSWWSLDGLSFHFISGVSEALMLNWKRSQLVCVAVWSRRCAPNYVVSWDSDRPSFGRTLSFPRVSFWVGMDGWLRLAHHGPTVNNSDIEQDLQLSNYINLTFSLNFSSVSKAVERSRQIYSFLLRLTSLLIILRFWSLNATWKWKYKSKYTTFGGKGASCIV